jgi:DNA-binding response OmpR family regulator
MQQIRILDVGQCGVDGPRMSRLFESKLKAIVDEADNLDETREKLADNDYNIVLVNRVLARDGTSGLDVIEAIVANGCDCPVMLVSDRDDAQEQALVKGAIRGFGKSQLSDDATLELICRTAGGGA